MQERRLEGLSNEELTELLMDLARIQQRALSIIAARQSGAAAIPIGSMARPGVCAVRTDPTSRSLV
ncbi:MAG: hypothetical protein ACXIUM_00230 [Wenzhouxiangella sp.]